MANNEFEDQQDDIDYIYARNPPPMATPQEPLTSPGLTAIDNIMAALGRIQDTNTTMDAQYDEFKRDMPALLDPVSSRMVGGFELRDSPTPDTSNGIDWSRVGNALSGFGAGLAGHGVQWQQMQAQKAQAQQALAERRQQMALRLQEIEEQKQQHRFGVMEKLLATGNPDALKAFAKQENFPLAAQIADAVSAKDLADLPSLVNEGYIPQDFMARMQSKQPPTIGEIRAMAQFGLDQRKVDMKAKLEQQAYDQAISTPEAQRRPSQQAMIDEREAKLEVERQTANLKKEQAHKAKAEAERGPVDHSVLNRVHEAITGGLSFDKGTKQTQDAALKQYFEGNAMGRRDVALKTTVGQTGTAQEWRDPISGKAAPSWALPDDLNRMGYVRVEPTQIPVIGQLQNVDASLKEIRKAGDSLLRRSGGKSWFEIPKGMLQRPLVELFQKYAGDPDTQLLQSAINRITPTLSRLGGDVANVAVAEREMYSQSIFNPSDTVESFAAKIKSIEDANRRTRTTMGMVPDQETYIRQLVLRGYTDKQIEAIIDERKRYQ